MLVIIPLLISMALYLILELHQREQVHRELWRIFANKNPQDLLVLELSSDVYDGLCVGVPDSSMSANHVRAMIDLKKEQLLLNNE